MHSFVPLIHPVEQGDIVPVHTGDHHMIDRMWRLFKVLPRSNRRLTSSLAAAMRMAYRQKSAYLPPRSAFTTTVDYYEAALPLYRAQKYANAVLLQDASIPMVGLDEAIYSVVPPCMF